MTNNEETPTRGRRIVDGVVKEGITTISHPLTLTVSDSLRTRATLEGEGNHGGALAIDH